MKIVVCSRTFVPLVGGLENVAEMTAHAFGQLGHQVSVVTHQQGANLPDRCYCVYRKPSWRAARREYKQAELILMMNVTTRMLAPMLEYGAKLLIWHQGLWSESHGEASRRLSAALKEIVVKKFAYGNLACSTYIADALPPSVQAKATGNPYDDSVFFPPHSKKARSGILFVGRLVSDKGADIAIKSLSASTGQLALSTLRIVGTGPEESSLRRLAVELGVTSRVQFLGAVRGEALAEIMRTSAILVVPSLWQEPFGIVALEGLACGCKVIVSESGGLPEAIGEFGHIVPLGDVAAMSETLSYLTEAQHDIPGQQDQLLSAHLSNHCPRAVALRIIEHFNKPRSPSSNSSARARWLK